MAIGAKIPILNKSLYPYNVVIYPQRGKGVIDPKNSRAKIKEQDDEENKLIIDGYGEKPCPDNKFLAGNTYTFIERNQGDLTPIHPVPIDENEARLQGYSQVEREWLKRNLEKAHRYEKKDEDSWFDKYGAYVGMIVFAGLILMHQFWSQKRDAKALRSVQGIAAKLQSTMDTKREITAMKEGYYQPKNTTQQPEKQQPPEGKSPP